MNTGMLLLNMKNSTQICNLMLPGSVRQSRVIRSPFIRGLVAILVLLISFTAARAESTTHAGAPDGTLELREELKAHLQTLDALVTQDETQSNIPFEDRVVVVTFFASWCPPCLKEFVALNAIKNKLGEDKITVVAVNVFEEFDNNDATRMAKFLDTTKPEFTVLKGTELSRKLFGNVRRIPTLLIFDQSGDLAFDFIHAPGAAADNQTVDDEELLNVIQPLI